MGIAYMLRIPIPRGGAYQVRFAVRDQQSGMLGSAGEFVEIGDIAGGAFALSGIVLRLDDGSGGGSAKVPDDIAITPAQALSVYRPGTRLSYAYEIYNAATPIQAATSVWRGTEKVLTHSGASALRTGAPQPKEAGAVSRRRRRQSSARKAAARRRYVLQIKQQGGTRSGKASQQDGRPAGSVSSALTRRVVQATRSAVRGQTPSFSYTRTMIQTPIVQYTEAVLPVVQEKDNHGARLGQGLSMVLATRTWPRPASSEAGQTPAVNSQDGDPLGSASMPCRIDAVVTDRDGRAV